MDIYRSVHPPEVTVMFCSSQVKDITSTDLRWNAVLSATRDTK